MLPLLLCLKEKWKNREEKEGGIRYKDELHPSQTATISNVSLSERLHPHAAETYTQRLPHRGSLTEGVKKDLPSGGRTIHYRGGENATTAFQRIVQLAEFGEGKILRLRLNLAGDGRADGGQLLHAGRQKHDVHHAAVVFVVLTIDIARLEQRSTSGVMFGLASQTTEISETDIVRPQS